VGDTERARATKIDDRYIRLNAAESRMLSWTEEVGPMIA
jgi:hypothetical protein